MLYRNVSPTIDPYTIAPFATSADSTFLDTSPLSGLYYYFIVAQDIHNNLSPVAVTQRLAATLNLTMLIQGFYNPSTNLMVQDTARVFLRNSTSPFSIVDSAKAYLSNTGAGTFTFSNAVNGVNYYLQVKHRNSLEAWSKTVQAFTANSLTYNFTAANAQAYGNNMINVDASPVRYADYSGDVNQDGYIDLNDISPVFNAAGYAVTDVNGDNIVDLSDLTLTFNNSSAFISVLKP